MARRVLPPTLIAVVLAGCGAPAAEALPDLADAGTAFVDGGAADGGGHDAALATGMPDVRALPAPVPPCAVLTLPTGVERVCPLEAAAADAVPLRDCVPGDAVPCDAPAGRYLPVVDGPRQRVWAPSDGRYLNEATLTRGPDAQWHVFSNAGLGPGSPWVEEALLHGTAPTLAGPWTLLPDAVHGGTAGAVDRQFWAPFVMPVSGGWRLAWMGQRGGGDEPGRLRTARSSNLRDWVPEEGYWEGGRDLMVLRLPDGTWLRYGTAVVSRDDGPHDVVDCFSSRDGVRWTAEPPALEHPRPCRRDCWGFFESPFVLTLGGYWYLFVTYTDSGPETYEQTVVLRSDNPRRFVWRPVATLPAHGAELHVEGGRMVLTHGGWPDRIGEAWRGLSATPLAWIRAE